jgi:hypothetical protein
VALDGQVCSSSIINSVAIACISCEDEEISCVFGELSWIGSEGQANVMH